MECRGMSCGNAVECAFAGHCTYESSAQKMLREQAEAEQVVLPGLDAWLEMPKAKAVEDFKGVVDGGGYKASMDDPRKVPLALIDPEYLDGIGRVLKHGARKYAPGNWMRGMSFSEVISAMQRHLGAIQRGENTDADTGELHTYHLSCGAMFLSRFLSHEEYASFDDRLFK